MLAIKKCPSGNVAYISIWASMEFAVYNHFQMSVIRYALQLTSLECDESCDVLFQKLKQLQHWNVQHTQSEE